MLPEVEAVVYSSEAIDALTVTSKSVEGRAMVAGIYRMFGEESEELALAKNWSSLGYKGYQCQSVRYGRRLDGSALFSSGEDAMKITHILIHDYDYTAIKTTRVDLCVDIALQKPSRGWLRGLRENGDFAKLHDKANRKTTVIESDTGDTLYIGSRQSGRFGRIYDKSELYNVGQGLVYRFELETKKQVAPAVFERLFPEKEDSTFSWDLFPSRVRGIIQGQFRKWGVDVSLGVNDAEQIRAIARISTVESQLQWLSRSVAPMLDKLDKLGYQEEMFEAIGYPLANVLD